MSCSTCGNLERVFEAARNEYIEARSSVCYRLSTRAAAKKNVEMERARYELEEHRHQCIAAVVVPVILPKREVPRNIRQMVA